VAYLLDTNTCIEYLRIRDPGVVTKIRTTPPNELRLCSVVLAELYHGAYKSHYPTANLSLLAKFVPQFHSLPFDDPAAEMYGRLRALLAAQGSLIGPYDLQIAAIALTNQLVLVTHNIHEFARVPGLTVEDWQGKG
jgi:tRNA(fMet)-specific endonuclease VapC